MKKLIVTADDFGADVAVNEAVEIAHRTGILTAASLMVGSPGAADAVRRARTMPALGVGLHLVLVEGRPSLPPADVAGLVDGAGNFRTNMVRAGIDMFFSPRARRQLAAEIEAQFAAFAATGLTLDHVNAHKHFHLHPTIAGLIGRIGARYGMTAVRAPVEPRAVLAAAEPSAALASDWVTAPWAKRVAHRFRRSGMRVPDAVFGLAWSGAMTTTRLRGLVANLPEGLSEIYFHPATRDDYLGHGPAYRHRDELAALVDPQVRATIAAAGISLERFRP